MSDIKRKGAKSVKDIPPEILIQLNSGEIETANLMEWLAIDQSMLLINFLEKNQNKKYFENALESINSLKKKTVNTINKAIGESIYQQAQLFKDHKIIPLMQKHPADMVRCWSVYATVKADSFSMAKLLERIQPFADDSHFGVREISWLAVRSMISEHLEESISILKNWSLSSQENSRRFASEATRPRGVWCAHIEALKKNPELAISILEPLKADCSQYVRDSVGNWLNDASKSNPDFVINLCRKWGEESPTKETQYIVKKSLRTINKN
jgi:3-methyladenine DNA glycosylase AlkC